jgi:P-type Cu2+ transporter
MGWCLELPLDGFDAFPLAAGGFCPFTLSPEIAALAMSGSSALVAINALTLKRTRLAGIRHFGGAAKIEAARR